MLRKNLIRVNFYSTHFVLEALKDQVSLSILELFDSLLLLEFVVLHRSTYVIALVLGMEHMRTEIQYSLLINLRVIRFYRVKGTCLPVTFS